MSAARPNKSVHWYCLRGSLHGQFVLGSRCKCFLSLFACVSVTSGPPLSYKLDQYTVHDTLNSRVLTRECISGVSDVTATSQPNFLDASATLVSDHSMFYGMVTYRGYLNVTSSHFRDAGVMKSSWFAAIVITTTRLVLKKNKFASTGGRTLPKWYEYIIDERKIIMTKARY